MQQVFKKVFVRLSVAIFAMFLLQAPLASIARDIMKNLTDRRYDSVKALLISKDIVPVRVVRHVSWLPCWGENFCQNHPEVLQCSGTGLAFCDFMFFDRKTRKYIRVTTYGEIDLRIYSIAYATKDDMEGWTPGR